MNRVIDSFGGIMQGNFIPKLIADKYNSRILKGDFEHTALIIDIVGFSNITDKLNEYGDEGSKVLAVLLNKSYNKIIDSIHNNDGFVTTFINNQFTALFINSTKSAYAAAEILKYFKENSIKETKLCKITIKIKIGISTGNIQYEIFDFPKMFNSFVFFGEAISTALEIQEKCPENSILVCKDFKQSIKGEINNRITFSALEENNEYDLVEIKDFNIRSRENTEKQFFPEQINNKFYSKNKISKVTRTTFKDIVSIFITFKDYSSLQKHMEELSKNCLEFDNYLGAIESSQDGFIAIIHFESIENQIMNKKAALSFIHSLSFFRELKIGISSGVVFSGILGNENRCWYTCVGKSVNESFDLMTLAKYGEIITNKNIYDLFKDKYQFVEKKKLPSQTKYILQKFKSISFFDDAFIGREKEVLQIKTILNKFNAEKLSKNVFIFGVQGIGKNRLVDESLKNLEYNLTIVSLLSENNNDEPFYSFKHYFRNLFKVRLNSSQTIQLKQFTQGYNHLIKDLTASKSIKKSDILYLTKIKDLIAEFIDLTPGNSLIHKLETHEIKQTIYFSIRTFFSIIAKKNPLLIIIQNLQWLDGSSLELFNFLLNHFRETPVSCLITSTAYNDVTKLKYDYLSMTEIELLGFTFKDVKNYLESYFLLCVDDEFATDIFDTVKGHPLFLEKLCDYLVEENLVHTDNKKAQLNCKINLFPKTFESLLKSQIATLDLSIQFLLKIAVVLGSEFDIFNLFQILKKSKNNLFRNLGSNKYDFFKEYLKDIDTLIQKGFIYKINEYRYIFRLNLSKEILLSLQSNDEIKIIHKLIANILKEKEFESPTLTCLLFKIATHFKKGKFEEESYRYFVKAGNIALKKNRLNFALKCFEKSVEIGENILNQYSNEKAKIYDLLGKTNYSNGNYSKAIDYYLKSHQIKNRILNNRNIEIIRSYYDIANCYYLNKEYKNALIYFEYFENISDYLTKINPYILTKVYFVLGEIHEILGEYDKSVQFLENSLNLRSKILGENNLESANIYSALADIYQSLNKPNQSLGFYKTALIIRKKIKGEKSLEVATSLNKIGVFYIFLEKYDKALNYLKRSLKIYNKYYGRDYCQLVSIYNNIAVVFENQKEYSKAILNYSKATMILEDSFFQNYSELAILYSNLGLIYCHIQNYDEALRNSKLSLHIRAKDLGDTHLHTALSYKNIAFIYEQKNDYCRAIEFYLKSIPAFETNLNKSDHAVLDIYSSCGRCYYFLDKYDKCIEFLTYSIEQKSILENRNNCFDQDSILLGISYLREGEYEQSIYVMNLLIDKFGIEVDINYSGSFCLYLAEILYKNPKVIKKIKTDLFVNTYKFNLKSKNICSILFQKALELSLISKNYYFYSNYAIVYGEYLISVKKIQKQDIDFIYKAKEFDVSIKIKEKLQKIIDNFI